MSFSEGVTLSDALTKTESKVGVRLVLALNFVKNWSDDSKSSNQSGQFNDSTIQQFNKQRETQNLQLQ